MLNVDGDDAMYWSEVADLTHATQVERFGFCTCEDGEKVYEDCLTEGWTL